MINFQRKTGQHFFDLQWKSTPVCSFDIWWNWEDLKCLNHKSLPHSAPTNKFPNRTPPFIKGTSAAPAYSWVPGFSSLQHTDHLNKIVAFSFWNGGTPPHPLDTDHMASFPQALLVHSDPKWNPCVALHGMWGLPQAMSMWLTNWWQSHLSLLGAMCFAILITLGWEFLTHQQSKQ